MRKISKISVLANSILMFFTYVMAATSAYSETDTAGTPAVSTPTTEEEFNPLAGSSSDTLIVTNDIQELISRFRHCDELKATVIMYKGDKSDGPVWIRASKKLFCKVALKPNRQSKIGICDVSKDVRDQLLTESNIKKIVSFDPKNDDLQAIITVIKPILDCFKNSSDFSPSPGGGLVKQQTQSTVIEDTVVKPESDRYGDMLR